MWLLIIVSGLAMSLAAAVAIYRKIRSVVVPEDHVAVTANKHNFIKRVLPAGKHLLRPKERVDFLLDTRTKLAAGSASAIATAEGVAVRVSWSGTYALRPELITDSRSQKLRGLQHAERAISRNVDLALRRRLGNHTTPQLFNPSLRCELEEQLNHSITPRLKPLGVALNGINLQEIELPAEVTDALNKATALTALDHVIRDMDPASREIVRGVYQLNEVLHWDQYLPVPSRRAMQKLDATAIK